jgi:hypothetical protein
MIAAPCHHPPVSALRGSHEVAGLFFDPAQLGSAECRRRVIRTWTTGAEVHEFHEGLLLLFSQPRRMDCDTAPGWPLAEVPGGWSTWPLPAKDDNASIHAPSQTVWIHRGGDVQQLTPSSATRVDPGSWLDLGSYRLVVATPLGALPVAPTPPAVAEPKPTHELLDAPGLAPTDDLLRWSAELRQTRTKFSFKRWLRGLFEGTTAAGSAVASNTATFAQRLWARLTTRRQAMAGEGPPTTAPAPRGPSLGERLTTFLGGAVLSFGLAAVMGRRFASYIQDLLRRMDTGDLDEALRRAIPLEGPGSISGMPRFSFFPGFLLNFFGGFGHLRKNLGISTKSGPARTLFFSGMFNFDFHELLRKRYLAMHERLHAEGRWKEAAFVLAQLLNDVPAAVAYLERHGQFRLAAELAEGRGATPALVVRAWFLAGEPDRAIRHALRHNAMETAIALLDRDRREDAKKLRILWAGILAEAGMYERAALVVEGVREANALAKRWLDLLIAMGGEAGARVLARRISSDLFTFEELRPALEGYLKESDPEARAIRAELAGHLISATNSRQKAVALRMIHRVLLRELIQPDTTHPVSSRSHYSSLLKAIDDVSLRIDTPDLTERVRWAQQDDTNILKRQKPLELWIRGTGTAPIHDAVRIARGCWLLAMGEAGVWLLDRHGRRLHVFPTPAHELIAPVTGTVVIAIARRGAYSSLARIDVASRAVHPWPDSLITHWSPRHDGLSWPVATDTTVSVLQIHSAKGPETAWQHTYKNGRILDIEGFGWPSTVLLGLDDGLYAERFQFSRNDKSKDLRRLRFEDSQLEGGFEKGALHHGGHFVFVRGTPDNPEAGISLHEIDLFSLAYAKHFGPPGARPLQPAISAEWCALPVAHEDDVLVYLLDISPRFENAIRAVIRLCGATQARARLRDDHLLLTDNTGRALDYHLHGGRLELSARVDLRP